MCCALAHTPLGPLKQRENRDSERPIRCGGCGRAYGPGAWLSLPIVSMLTIDAIAPHVVKWPRGVLIEVRRCAQCARSIARTVEAAST
jgi:hypothetical protein